MDPEERLTYRLLSHYAFVLNENPSSISDSEIQTARDFSKEYLQTHNILPNGLDKELKCFINNQRAIATSGVDYNEIKDQVKDDFTNIYENGLINGLINIYHDINLDDDQVVVGYLNSENDYHYRIYNIKNRKIYNFDNKCDETDLELLGTISLDKSIKI